MSRHDVAQEARRWLGTPYLHQASICGAGTDCLGLIRGIWRAVCGAEPEEIPPYTQDWSEPQKEEVLWQSSRRWLVERGLDQENVGDILLFRMSRRSVAKHLGVLVSLGPNASFIHAYSRHGVVETGLSQPWRARVVARFSFP